MVITCILVTDDDDREAKAMKIHTDTLGSFDLHKALSATGLTDVQVHVSMPKSGSRSHARAYEVALRGIGARHKRPPAGAPYHCGNAATYEDWGKFLAEVFKGEATVKAGPYKGWRDFHVQTKNKFNRCEFCQGTADVEISEDPFAADVYDDNTPVSICRQCQGARADEV